ncbi:peptidoglycan-binding protein LysM [Bdellovibrio sp. HCB337]|uniref:peptidoglycan-binding protein LysM n=1 Tax=Bdellovibrio sp. HCB337 TaxID=3394358 RepID=UPI0039A7309A
MGIMSFFKDAGEKLFGSKEANPDSIKKYIQSQGISTEGLTIDFDKASDTVKVSGKVPDQATKEKILLCCGNVQGVAKVDDNITVAQAAPASQYYTVQSGDTLSKIAARFYGDAMKYPAIFEANRPMLSHPDKIYPGQNLRIPPPEARTETVAEHHP